MPESVLTHESDAVAMLCRLGVSKLAARRVLATVPVSCIDGDGIAYYMHDDIEACADCYLDAMES